MAAPICTHIGKLLETMRNAMVDLLFIWVCLCIGLADTFCNHACIALRVASVFAVFALHTRRVLEEIATQCTTHDVVELLLHELVTIHLVDLFLPLADSTLSVESNIERSSVFCLFRETKAKMHRSSRLQSKPCVNRCWSLGNGRLCAKPSASRAEAYSLRGYTKLCWLGGASKLLGW